MDDIKALKEALEAMLRSASMHAGDWESREGDVNEWGTQCYEVDGERVQELATAYGATTAAYIAACSPARIARLLERLEKADRDAERWRTAREMARYNSYGGVARVDFGSLPWPAKTLPDTADYADAAIDAMAQEKQP